LTPFFNKKEIYKFWSQVEILVKKWMCTVRILGVKEKGNIIGLLAAESDINYHLQKACSSAFKDGLGVILRFLNTISEFFFVAIIEFTRPRLDIDFCP